jgi:phosphate transport system protein
MSQRNVSEANSAPANRRRGLVAQDDVWSEVLKLAAVVESMLEQAAQALCEGRVELVAGVKAQERNIDRWEVRIEQECIRVLALYGPLASDLRRIVSALKLRANLERISDLATKIAKKSMRLRRDTVAPPIPASLYSMASMATDAFSDVVAALDIGDADHARAVITGAKVFDRQFQVVLRELKESLRHQPELVTPLLRLVNLARNLKRIGDHSISIAEAIVHITGAEVPGPQ